MEEYLKDDETRIAKLKQIWKTIIPKNFKDFNPIIFHIIIYEKYDTNIGMLDMDDLDL